MFIEAKKIAKYDKMIAICDWACSSEIIPPIMIIPEIAFDTLINGECKLGVTRQITK